MRLALYHVMMDTAHNFASLSYAKRSKVGAVLVRDRRIIACGYNGTLPGTDNRCENEDGTTSDFVMHAEQNVLTYCASQGIPVKGATLFITMAPCKNCAKLIISSGISKVIYDNAYRDMEGVEFMRKFIPVVAYSDL